MKKINTLKRAMLLCLCASLSVSALAGANNPYVFADDFTEWTELTDPTDPTELTELTNYSTNSNVLYSGTMIDVNWHWQLTDSGVLTITINPGGSTSWTDTPWQGLPWYIYRNNITKVELPEGLLNVGERAFLGYQNIEEIDFPNSLEKIEAGAFEVCLNLKKVDLSETKVKIIGESAFRQSDYTEVIFPNSLEEIGKYAFKECRYLETADLSETNLKFIGAGAFESSGPTSITFPKTLETIEAGERGAFENSFVETVDFSKTNLKVINEKTFFHAQQLTSIIFPESLEEIENEAFAMCISLETADLSETNLKTIGNQAFYFNIVLTSNFLPYGLTTIGQGAFFGCLAFKDIFIPDSVTSIGARVDWDGVFHNEMIIFANYGSYAIEWADAQGYTWFYQAHKLEMQASPPPDIHQNVPVEFTFNTEIPGNRGMKFKVTPDLPAGLFLQTDDKGDYAPGTIYGVVTDPAEIGKHNGETFTFTAHPVSYTDDTANYTEGKYDVKVDFVLTLVPNGGDPTVSGDVTDMFGFKDEGRLGGDTGEVELDEEGNPITSPVMYIDAPFSGSNEGEYGFQGFYINGEEQEEGVDYDVEEGSTIITIRDQTFAELDDGNHTATATFRRVAPDSSDISLSDWKDEAGDWDIRVQAVSQNFTIHNPNSSSDPGSNPDSDSQPQPDPQPQPQSNSQSNQQPDTQNRNSTRSQQQPQSNQSDQQANAENETPVVPIHNTAQNMDSTPSTPPRIA
ncbi:MAG: leucine-rich repeat domain-containing protein [Oscillospiraceae bacterium]|nr:leucine-rich repeat domain-containing protein [Oscillospiraceae bacterium]